MNIHPHGSSVRTRQPLPFLLLATCGFALSPAAAQEAPQAEAPQAEAPKPAEAGDGAAGAVAVGQGFQAEVQIDAVFEPARLTPHLPDDA